MICFNCNKEGEWEVKSEPNRHMLSPRSFNHDRKAEDRLYDFYCSKQCQQETNNKRYAWFADLDRNASDSTCFAGEGWEGEYRVGVCRVTGEKVKVVPLCPAINSGQPEECTKHFDLRPQYKEYLKNNETTCQYLPTTKKIH